MTTRDTFLVIIFVLLVIGAGVSVYYAYQFRELARKEMLSVCVSEAATRRFATQLKLENTARLAGNRTKGYITPTTTPASDVESARICIEDHLGRLTDREEALLDDLREIEF